MPDSSDHARREKLAVYALMTVPELVVRLPLNRRLMLALGPIPDDAPESETETCCRVCDALLDIEWRSPAATLLLDFHEEEGRRGAACYRRCCDIYKAAGWEG